MMSNSPMVAVASAALNDQRDRIPEPPPAEVIARQVRNALREQDIILPPETERITEIIATEITRHTKPPV